MRPAGFLVNLPDLRAARESAIDGVLLDVCLEQNPAAVKHAERSLVTRVICQSSWNTTLGGSHEYVLGASPVGREHDPLPVRSPEGIRVIGLVRGDLECPSAVDINREDVAFVAERHFRSVWGDRAFPEPFRRFLRCHGRGCRHDSRSQNQCSS